MESAEVRKLLKQLWQVPQSWWTRIEQKSIRGTPDIFGCVQCQCGHAKIVALEAKALRGKPTALQVEIIAQLQAVGAFAQVVTLPTQAREVLDSLRKLRDPGPFLPDNRAPFLPDQESS